MQSPVLSPIILYESPQDRSLFIDCACAVDAPTPVLQPPRPARQWRLVPGLYQAPLPQQNHLAFNPTGPAGVVVLNADAQQLLASYQRPQPLHHPQAAPLAQLQLLTPVDAPAPASSCLPAPTQLTAWLHLTNACNLNCAYCYLKKSQEQMDLTTGIAAVDTLFRQVRQHGFQSLRLKYAGGEPTLNFDLIRQLHPYAKTQAQRLGVALEAVILSNGVRLTPEMLDFLREQDIDLSISLDGLGEAHDAQRPLLGGQPSSPYVLRNIDLALAHGLRPHLSITITDANIDAIPDVVAYALEREIYFNFNFYRTPAQGDKSARRAANEKLTANVLNALAVIEDRLPHYSLFANLIDRANFAAPHTHPCGVNRNYLVIDHHGSIARCHMIIDQPVTDIWHSDPLLALQTTPSPSGFHNPSVEEKNTCSTCTWRYWCAGGCPLEALRTSGRTDVRSPYCEVYQAVFPEILRLEALRLMRYRSSPEIH